MIPPLRRLHHLRRYRRPKIRCRTRLSTTTNTANPNTNTVNVDGVIIHQGETSSSQDLGLVWGNVLWPSGVSLSKYLRWKGPSYLQSKHNGGSVLELGCGTGLVGLTAWKLGSRNVTLTDSEPALWPTIRQNIEANCSKHDDDDDDERENVNISIQRTIGIHCLDWRDPSTFLLTSTKTSNGRNIRQPFDLILAADVLYSGMDKLFARALAAHLPSREELIGTTLEPTKLILHDTSEQVHLPYALVACPFREDSPLIGFFQAASRLGLGFERLQNQSGEAVGGYHEIDADDIYEGSFFVSLESSETQQKVANAPSFSLHNIKKVQIFRIRRLHGSAESASKIRRVSRI